MGSRRRGASDWRRDVASCGVPHTSSSVFVVEYLSIPKRICWSWPVRKRILTSPMWIVCSSLVIPHPRSKKDTPDLGLRFDRREVFAQRMKDAFVRGRTAVEL
jgi:hypothetical protein